MTIEAIIELLLQHGSLGIFAGYLIFESHRLRKQQEKTIEAFTAALEKLREDSIKKESDLRVRYDSVISSLQEENKKMSDNVENKILLLEQKIAEVITSIANLKEAVQELKLREIARNQKA
jgi:tyrosine-protein phosphatase YwqE